MPTTPAPAAPLPPEEPLPELPHRGLNPFNYSVAELSKTIVALIGFVGFVLLSFLTFDPSLVQAVELLVPAFATVALVFASTNHTPYDLNKALQGLVAAVITVVSYFTTVPADTANKIAMAVGALVVVVGVYWKGNQGS